MTSFAFVRLGSRHPKWDSLPLPWPVDPQAHFSINFLSIFQEKRMLVPWTSGDACHDSYTFHPLKKVTIIVIESRGQSPNQQLEEEEDDDDGKQSAPRADAM
jgi:hypothetical protein